MMKDLHIAARALLRQPKLLIGFWLLVGFGIAGCVAAWAAFDRVYMRESPFPQPDRLISIWTTPHLEDRRGVDLLQSNQAMQLMDSPPQGFTGITAFGLISTPVVRYPADTNRVIAGAAFYQGFFDVLRLRPLRGRNPDNIEATDAVVLISEQLASSLFGSENAVGQTVHLLGRRFTVIGIIGNRKAYPIDAQFWVPAAGIPEESRPVVWRGVARLAPGMSIDQAIDLLMTHARQQAVAIPNLAAVPQGLSASPLDDTTATQSERNLISILSLAVVATMLIVLLNMSGMLLLRVVVRRDQHATRRALGASLLDIARPVFAENVVLIFGALAVGLLSAVWLTDILAFLEPALGDAGVDWGAIGAATLFALLILAALTAGPVLHLWRIPPSSALQASRASGSKGERVLRTLTLAVQVAVAIAVSAVAAVLLNAVSIYADIDVGFDAEAVVTMSPDWRSLGFDDAAQEDVAKSLAEGPGAQRYEAAAYWRSRETLFPTPPIDQVFSIEGATFPLTQRHLPSYEEVSQSFGDVMGLHMAEGRWFTQADQYGARPVVVVSERAAAMWWPGQSALGRRIRLGDVTAPWLEVIGVVQRYHGSHNLVRFWSLDGPRERPHVLRPIEQAGSTPPTGWAYRHCFYCGGITVGVRSESTASVQSAITDLKRGVEFLGDVEVQTMFDRQMRSFGTRQLRREGTIMAIFGLFMAILAVAGTVSIIGLTIQQQKREIAIRVALGAPTTSIIRVVARRTLFAVALGGACGSLIALLVFSGTNILFGSELGSLVPQSARREEVVVPAVAMLVVFLTLAGAVATGLRAANVDPRSALVE